MATCTCAAAETQKLTLEQFWLLLRQLRTHGITEINGDLVLDRSAFAVPIHDAAAFDNEPLRPYNAGPDALLVNLKSVRLSLLTAPEKEDRSSCQRHTKRRHTRRQSPTTHARRLWDWREKIKIKISGLNIELDRQLFRQLWRKGTVPFPMASQCSG